MKKEKPDFAKTVAWLHTEEAARIIRENMEDARRRCEELTRSMYDISYEIWIKPMTVWGRHT